MANPNSADPRLLLANGFLPNGPVPAALIDTRQLPDGRLVALVQDLGQAPAYVTGPNRLMVFAFLDGRWFVDESTEIALPRVAEQTPAATARERSPILEVVLQDEGGRIWDSPTTMGTYRAGIDVIVTVANVGTVDQRFAVPALGIEVDVPAGHSVSFTMRAPVSRCPYYSVAVVDERATPLLQGSFEFVPMDAPLGMG